MESVITLETSQKKRFTTHFKTRASRSRLIWRSKVVCTFSNYILFFLETNFNSARWTYILGRKFERKSDLLASSIFKAAYSALPSKTSSWPSTSSLFALPLRLHHTSVYLCRLTPCSKTLIQAITSPSHTNMIIITVSETSLFSLRLLSAVERKLWFLINFSSPEISFVCRRLIFISWFRKQRQRKI